MLDLQHTSSQSSPPPIPSPLSVPGRVYARACKASGVLGGVVGAIERYRLLHRSGERTQTHLNFEEPVLGRVHESMSSEGMVRKFTLPVDAGAAQGRLANPTTLANPTNAPLEIESVIIPMIGKRRIQTHTLCVSSQVGCAMGCGFCQTAQMGLIRNLSSEEIVRQWWVARHDPRLACASITNIVFMGMGEPMDNLDAVIDAIAVLSDHDGPGLPMSKITVSTVGRVDGIERLAAKVHTPGWHRLNLAISVNAPNDSIRATIMPVTRRYPLSDLRAALEAWPIYGAAKLCIEYVLIPGVNDHREHAQELGDWVIGRGAYAGRPALPGLVNIIPYNPRDASPWPAPEETHVDAFLGWCLEERLYAKRRRTKGRDTMAACGQLGNPEMRRSSRVGVTISAER